MALRIFLPQSKRFLNRSLSAVSASGHLRILVVDGYAQKSREEFAEAKLPLASSLYKEMLQQQAPKGTQLEFHTIFPCAPDYEAPTDRDLEQYDGAAFTGSSYSAYNEEEDVKCQIDLLLRTFKFGVSSFGSCWGIQIAAEALGGKVELNPKGREVGVGRNIFLTPEGRGHPMFSGKKNVFQAFMSHGDEVTQLPAGAIVTASNDHSRVQAMTVTHLGTESWFVQYHPEYDLEYYIYTKKQYFFTIHAGLIATRVERMIKLGFFSNKKDVDVYVKELKELHLANESLKIENKRSLKFDSMTLPKKNIAWKYGINDDILNDDMRRIEVRNWIKYLLSIRM